MTARDLIDHRLCSAACLLASASEPCTCRCMASWHGVLTGTEVAVITVAPAVRRAAAYELVPPEGGQRAMELFASDLDDGAVPSVRHIRRVMHVGQARAQKIRTYLAALAASGASYASSSATNVP
jgi:hypothetical protein